MAEHTPGPWHWKARELRAPKSVVLRPENGRGELEGVMVSDADARLIAAAPALLAALKGVLRVADRKTAEFDAARAAIAAAEGVAP
jgi:hypothetical protein